MAECSLAAKQAALCTSGIGKVNSHVQLLQVVAQTLCGASLTPPTPPDYNNRLVYIQTNGAETIIEDPTGIIDLSAIAPPITEIHSNNAPNLLAIFATGQASLVVFDVQNLTSFLGFNLDGCSALPSINLAGFTSLVVASMQGCTALQTLTIPNLVTMGNMVISGTGIVNFSAPSLTTLSNTFTAESMAALTSFSAPVLTSCTSFTLADAPLLASLDIDQLTTANGVFGIRNTGLASISLPNLTTCGGNSLDFNTNTSLTTLDLSSMGPAGFSDMDISGCSSLPSFSLPAWDGPLPQFLATNCTNLGSFSFGGGPPSLTNGQSYNFRGCALDETSVDFVINAGTEAGMNSGLIYLDAGTNSPPSAGGAIQAAALATAGVDIQTN